MTTAGDESDKTTLLLPPSIVEYLERVLGEDTVANATIRKAKSAQQQVFIVSFPADSCQSSFLPEWQDALTTGCNNIVVRIWKGSARWWNLHSSHSVSEFNENSHEPGVLLLARAEVAGYRAAREALALDSQLEIPKVLYFSHDCKGFTEKQPWAVMSYVGPDSAFFDSKRRHTNEWVDGMITIRPEFGFEEPHPRWGRVPVDQCIDYVLHVLERFTIPMHRYFFCSEDTPLNPLADIGSEPRTYSAMVKLYKKAHLTMNRVADNGIIDETQARIVNTLGLCIRRLQEESVHVKDMPPVLCHMDCQPQNLIFYRNEMSEFPQLHSVLDWEEAAFADPRFEILLLCRKVCANAEQAQAVWATYTKKVASIDCRIQVGAIDPWLRLETVHSITTLVLQSLNLLNGGRSPWETKPDLVDKIDREFQRLTRMGWTFCKVIQ